MTQTRHLLIAAAMASILAIAIPANAVHDEADHDLGRLPDPAHQLELQPDRPGDLPRMPHPVLASATHPSAPTPSAGPPERFVFAQFQEVKGTTRIITINPLFLEDLGAGLHAEDAGSDWVTGREAPGSEPETPDYRSFTLLIEKGYEIQNGDQVTLSVIQHPPEPDSLNLREPLRDPALYGQPHNTSAARGLWQEPLLAPHEHQVSRVINEWTRPVFEDPWFQDYWQPEWFYSRGNNQAKQTEKSLGVEAPIRMLAAQFEATASGAREVVAFDGVPAAAGAQYVLAIGQAKYAVEPFTDAPSMPGVGLVSPASASSSRTSCSNTFSNFDWQTYGRFWIDDASAFSWKNLAWGGWQYDWEYFTPCDYGQHHVVRPVFGFGLHGLNRLPVGGSYNTYFGFAFEGERWTQCHHRGSYQGTVCHGHIAVLSNPIGFFRQVQQDGVEHVHATVLGVPSETCTTLVPEPARQAINVIALRYSALGVASFVPDEYCKEEWKTVRSAPEPGLGFDVTGARSVGKEVQATGFVTTEYHVLGRVPTELKAAVSYDVWMKSCPSCTAQTLDGGHHYVVSPPFLVV